MNADALRKAAASTADAVTLDLVSDEARTFNTRAARAALRTLTAAGRTVDIRLGPARSERADIQLDALLDSGHASSVRALLLASPRTPQDVRDADVAIRKREMRADVEPGSIRLITEIASAITLRDLAALVEAVDRHGALALNVDALAADLRLPAGSVVTGGAATGSAATVIDHAMAQLAIHAAAAKLPWVVLAPSVASGVRAELAGRAFEHGAAGVYVASATETRGLNALFDAAL